MYRLHRGEGYKLGPSDLRAMRERLNPWLRCLIGFSNKRKALEQAGEKTKQQKTDPALQPEAVAAAAAAAAASSGTQPEMPLPSNTVQQDELKWGCSKCRFAPSGCCMCNPVKAAKYVDKLESKTAQP